MKEETKTPVEGRYRIRRIHAALDAIISPNMMGEKLAGGFGFTEGPVWVRDAPGEQWALLAPWRGLGSLTRNRRRKAQHRESRPLR